MASFNDVNSEELVDRSYAGKKVVYLESEEDVQVFRERWFIDRGQFVDFFAVSEPGRGGCNDVITRVATDRAANIDAWGVVDRDALASKGEWDAFFDTDDEHFASRNALGEYVLVLKRWEMENYLLHPEVIEQHVADIKSRSPRPVEQVVEELFDILCCKLPLVAANMLLNSYGRTALPHNFGHSGSCSALLDNVARRLEKEGLGDVFEECLERITSFGGGHAPRTLDHWFALTRMVDGKMALKWIRTHYHLQDECRFIWARSIRERGMLPDVIDPSLWNLVCNAGESNQQ